LPQGGKAAHLESSMLFGKLLPREGNFFELFNQHGGYIMDASRAFMLLIRNYPDQGLRDKYADDVINAERGRPHHG
jgi:uncharacterized protein